MAIRTLMFSRNQFSVKIRHCFENQKAACTSFIDFAQNSNFYSSVDQPLVEFYFQVFTEDFAMIFLKSLSSLTPSIVTSQKRHCYYSLEQRKVVTFLLSCSAVCEKSCLFQSVVMISNQASKKIKLWHHHLCFCWSIEHFQSLVWKDWRASSRNSHLFGQSQSLKASVSYLEQMEISQFLDAKAVIVVSSFVIFR